LPKNGKWCSFDCIYCECGWNEYGASDKTIPSIQEVADALEQKLLEIVHKGVFPNVITFSGNGEPTLHPHFKEIVQNTIALRNQYVPKTKICVLSNATQLHRSDVFEALMMVDKRVLKIDSAFPQTVQTIDQPAPGYNLGNTIEHIKRFDGDFSLQTLFVRGFYNGSTIDNTTHAEIDAWLTVIKELKPKEVMIYTIDRETPAKELEKIPLKTLEEIATKVRSLGLDTIVTIAG
jgi:wyosine [tRNA(Phe)-imidazoG37] synthetase (radical SAM superfamily)